MICIFTFVKIYRLRYLIFLLIWVTGINLQAQSNTFKIGIKGGISKYDYGLSKLIISDPKLSLTILDKSVGFQGGAVIQIKLGKFLIQPEFIFNSNKVNYSVSDSQFSLVDTLLSETYRDLDIPLMLGFKSGILRLNVGPVGHIHLSSTSELFEFDSYSQKFDKLKYGWQAGIGLDIWKIMIDIRYEGNFSKFGDHIVFNGRKYSFADNPNRLLVTAGLLF